MREAIIKTEKFIRKIAFGVEKRYAFARANIRNKKKASS